MRKLFLVCVLVFLLMCPNTTGSGQGQDEYPVYIVQAGDTLYSIALRFNVTQQELIALNGIPDPNYLPIGTRLKIPGLAGIQGILIIKTVTLTEDLLTISNHHRLSMDLLLLLNRITSPNEVYAGAEIILVDNGITSDLDIADLLQDGSTILESAIKQKTNPASLTFINHRNHSWSLLPGERVFNFPERISAEVSLFGPIQNIEIKTLPLIQGSTALVSVTLKQDGDVNGLLGTYPLVFFQSEPGKVFALQGIYRNDSPGLLSLSLSYIMPGGKEYLVTKELLLKAGKFNNSAPLVVPPGTINQDEIKLEEEQVRQIVAPVTGYQYWDGAFVPPTDEPDCITAWFGDNRVYNNTYRSFHGGVDYGVCAKPSLNIYAPAAGVVAFVGPLTICGNATFIDHGLGVFTGICHQKEIIVQVGQKVEPGQLIGYIGATGRATGPHLHWELWVRGNKVNPLEWLERIFP